MCVCVCVRVCVCASLGRYLEGHSVTRNLRNALELCLREEPALPTEAALQFVADELAKQAR